MANPDRRATPEDLAEFGDHALAGAPSIAALIAILPEHAREAYRQERRGALIEILTSYPLGAGPSIARDVDGEVCLTTWRAYFERSA